MRRAGGLWACVTAWPNLLLAARKARRGKRRRPCVERFHFNAEWELLRLRDELLAGTYAPGPFTTHTIHRPKRRLISAAPYRDRVVHHALMNVLEPVLDRGFHPHSYACRKGKGTQAAADRLQHLLGQYHYLIPCDVTKFFPSIDHDILKGLLRRKVKCRPTLALIERVIDTSNDQDSPLHYFPADHLFTPAERRRGLPIGNLTSQWFANLYLDGLDHFVTARLGFGGYVRYCDDFVLLGDDPAELRAAFDRVVEYAAGLRLKLHTERAELRPTRRGVTFVGFRTWPTHRYLRKPNIRAFRRRFRGMAKACLAGRITFEEVTSRVQSWFGHLLTTNGDALLLKTLRQLEDLKKMKKTRARPSAAKTEEGKKQKIKG